MTAGAVDGWDHRQARAIPSQLSTFPPKTKSQFRIEPSHSRQNAKKYSKMWVREQGSKNQ